MRTAIVLTYYDRAKQLQETFESFDRYKEKKVDLIIVNDGPDSDISPHKTIPTTIINTGNKDWHNSAPAYNFGLIAALTRNPDIIIIQNAECYHAGDIIGYAEKNLTDKNYISFGCYSLADTDTIPPPKINPFGASYDGQSAWYNHPIYRPCGYHFCSAITAANLHKLNGFDERVAFGIGYEDDVWLHQVKNLGLNVLITDEPFVYHQWHYNQGQRDTYLIKKNADLWEELKQSKEYRAMHLITPDL